MTVDLIKNCECYSQRLPVPIDILPIYACSYKICKDTGDFQVIGITRKLCNLIGCTADEIINDSNVYFSRINHDKVINIQLLANTVKVGDEFKFTSSFSSKKYGEMFFVEDSVITGVDEDYVYSMCCLTDVTELRCLDTALDFTEDRLEFALSSADIGVWQWSLDDDITANKIAWQLVGENNSNVHFKLREFAKKIHKEDRSQIFVAVKDLLFGVTDSFKVEMRVNVAGEFKWLCVVGSMIKYDDANKHKIMTGIIRDLSGSVEYLIEKKKMHDILSDHVKARTYELETEIVLCKQAEAQLLDNLRKERDMSEMKSVFVNMVSHEFRTPLAVIQMAVDLLAQHYDALSVDERFSHFETIRLSIKRMTRIMDDVLMLGKVQDGKLRFNPQTTNIVQLVQNILDEVEFLKDNKRVVFATDQNLPSTVCVDQSLMYHIIVNLLSNALKYSSEDKNVLLKLEYDNGRLYIIIRDYGIGIPEKDIKNLFKLFYRGSNISNRKGLGVGMYVVDRCVKLHGGCIDISSQENIGTIFKVALPLS